jgi:hypothetical protein
MGEDRIFYGMDDEKEIRNFLMDGITENEINLYNNKILELLETSYSQISNPQNHEDAMRVFQMTTEIAREDLPTGYASKLGDYLNKIYDQYESCEDQDLKQTFGELYASLYEVYSDKLELDNQKKDKFNKSGAKWALGGEESFSDYGVGDSSEYSVSTTSDYASSVSSVASDYGVASEKEEAAKSKSTSSASKGVQGMSAEDLKLARSLGGQIAAVGKKSKSNDGNQIRGNEFVYDRKKDSRVSDKAR